jgi:hypothetical protein
MDWINLDQDRDTWRALQNTVMNLRNYMELTGQLHVPDVLPPVPIGQEAGWVAKPVWRVWSREKSPASAGNQNSAFVVY